VSFFDLQFPVDAIRSPLVGKLNEGQPAGCRRLISEYADVVERSTTSAFSFSVSSALRCIVDLGGIEWPPTWPLRINDPSDQMGPRIRSFEPEIDIYRLCGSGLKAGVLRAGVGRAYECRGAGTNHSVAIKVATRTRCSLSSRPANQIHHHEGDVRTIV